MSWVKVDDKIFLNRKFRAASDSARLLYWSGLCFSAQAETDGVILTSDLPVVAAYSRTSEVDVTAAELVKLGLWECTSIGYQIHDYLEYQPAKSHLEAERKRKREWAAANSGASSASNSGASSAPVATSRSRSRSRSDPRSPSPDLNNGDLLKDDHCPAAEPAGHGSGAGGDVPVLQLVPTEADQPEATKPSKPDSWKNVLAVFNHYHHAHHHPMRRRLKPTSKTARAIATRLRDGWTVEELCKAVDGFHLSPHHQGQNDRGTVYLDLYLFVRDEEQVEKGIGYAENPPKPGSNKPARDIRVGWFPAEACQHPDKPGRVDLP